MSTRGPKKVAFQLRLNLRKLDIMVGLKRPDGPLLRAKLADIFDPHYEDSHQVEFRLAPALDSDQSARAVEALRLVEAALADAWSECPVPPAEPS